MKFKLDENIGQRGINQLKQAGYDVSTVLEQGLTSASDPTVIKVCQQEDRCLVTLDLDFSNPLQYVPSQYKGIAVLRLPPRATIEDLTDAIQTLVTDVTWNSDDESFAASTTGQPRGDCPYPNNLDFCRYF